MLRKLILLGLVVTAKSTFCAQPAQNSTEAMHRKCYIYELASERHQVPCESQGLRCPKTLLIMLNVNNLIYDQETKNTALVTAVKKCDYCAAKFWLEHGADFGHISQTSVDKDGTLAYRFNPYTVANLLLNKDQKPFRPYQSSEIVEKMLCVLKPYGVKRIQVHMAGQSSDATYHSKTTTYE